MASCGCRYKRMQHGAFVIIIGQRVGTATAALCFFFLQRVALASPLHARILARVFFLALNAPRYSGAGEAERKGREGERLLSQAEYERAATSAQCDRRT